MSDRHLFWLNDEKTHDLAFDKNQWMIRRIRTVKGQPSAQPLWYVGGAKRILRWGIGREGIRLSDNAREALDSLPATFGDFLYERAQQLTPPDT